MTDNILYLDEQGYPCDDYRDIHEAIEETTKMLLSMTKAERIEWFRKSRYPIPSTLIWKSEVHFIPYPVILTELQTKACRKRHSELS